MSALLAELRGIRRVLLTLAILFFSIMLLEVDLGHRPALAGNEAWLAIIPVLWLPVTLMALMALQVKPARATAFIALFVTAIAAVIGAAGSGLHMMAAGVDFAHLARIFSSAVWGGPVSPNWPVAITVAAVLGFAGALGALGAERSEQGLPRGLAGAASGIAYLLILAAIVCAALPALSMVSSACLAAAALLLLAVLIALLAGAAMQRSLP